MRCHGKRERCIKILLITFDQTCLKMIMSQFAMDALKSVGGRCRLPVRDFCYSTHVYQISPTYVNVARGGVIIKGRYKAIFAVSCVRTLKYKNFCRAQLQNFRTGQVEADQCENQF